MYVYLHTCICLSNRQEWMRLQDLIATRSKNLAGAYDIHKFNSDAKEILGRIQVCMNHCLARYIIIYICVYVCMYLCVYVHM